MGPHKSLRHRLFLLALLGLLDAKLVSKSCDRSPLFFNRVTEFIQSTNVQELPGDQEGILNCLMSDGSNVGSDLLSNFEWHAGRAKKVN